MDRLIGQASRAITSDSVPTEEVDAEIKVMAERHSGICANPPPTFELLNAPELGFVDPVSAQGVAGMFAKVADGAQGTEDGNLKPLLA